MNLGETFFSTSKRAHTSPKPHFSSLGLFKHRRFVVISILVRSIPLSEPDYSFNLDPLQAQTSIRPIYPRCRESWPHSSPVVFLFWFMSVSAVMYRNYVFCVRPGPFTSASNQNRILNIIRYFMPTYALLWINPTVEGYNQYISANILI